tara:strand:+ start:5681 stop:6004 length:324 start_codon:yes stop_codon:yes gene_type:complete
MCRESGCARPRDLVVNTFVHWSVLPNVQRKASSVRCASESTALSVKSRPAVLSHRTRAASPMIELLRGAPQRLEKAVVAQKVFHVLVHARHNAKTRQYRGGCTQARV